MKKEIVTEIVIEATPAQVWAVLTDFEAYPQWNPFVKSLTGDVAVGRRIKVLLPGMTFTPKVLVFDAPREFKWLGNLFIPGLFDGEHRFQLLDNGNGSTTFIHSERFNGLLVGLFNRMLERDTRPGFEALNRALKQRVEGRVRS